MAYMQLIKNPTYMLKASTIFDLITKDPPLQHNQTFVKERNSAQLISSH